MRDMRNCLGPGRSTRASMLPARRSTPALGPGGRNTRSSASTLVVPPWVGGWRTNWRRSTLVPPAHPGGRWAKWLGVGSNEDVMFDGYPRPLLPGLHPIRTPSAGSCSKDCASALGRAKHPPSPGLDEAEHLVDGTYLATGFAEGSAARSLAHARAPAARSPVRACVIATRPLTRACGIYIYSYTCSCFSFGASTYALI